jgi:alkylation response protein AidB-like acyl-CoA dehydrogenase
MIVMDHAAILTRAQEVAHDVVATHAVQVDAQAQWPEASLRALQAAGLGGLVIPQMAGGLGGGMLTLVQVCEILGQHCSSTALCFGMHCVGSAVIAAKATGDQRERYLLPISQGQHLTTLVLSEPGTGSHFYLPQTQLAHESPSQFRVTGNKTFVTSGGHADSYVISTVAADPYAPPGQFSCVIVPGDTPGLRWGEPWRGLGMRGNSSRTLSLDHVPVPRSNLLGNEGDEIWYIFAVVAPYFLMAMAGTYLGIAQAALDEARHHLTSRIYSHTGGSLAQEPILQHRFGTLWAQVERTRQLIYMAAQKGDQGDPQALPSLTSAKAEVAECAVQVVNDAMTLMGGITYREGGRMERLLRDARAAHVMSPTTDILRLWTGRAVLEQPLLAD